MRSTTIVPLALLTACAAITGCASNPPRPALISHVVFLEAMDERDVPALRADCDASLAGIPGVASYASGAPLDTGRGTVLADYDLGLYIGFNSEEDLAGYVSHPRHVGLVERWKPRLNALRVYDFQDGTP